MNAACAALSAVGGHGMDAERARVAPPKRASLRRCRLALSWWLGLGLAFAGGSTALAEPEPPRPETPAPVVPPASVAPSAPAPSVQASEKPKEPIAAKAAPSRKPAAEPKKPRLLIELPPSPPPPPEPAEAKPVPGRTPSGPTSLRKEVRLPLAPTAAELAKPDKIAPPHSPTMKESANNPALPQD